MKTCAFTGHRNLVGTDFDELLLRRVVSDLVAGGTTRFLCGMAVGFDMKAAQAVIALKKEKKIELVACIPCENQAERFSAENKRLYCEILGECDDKIIFSKTYSEGCMHRRDRYLVDNCDVLVSFLRKKSGGTYYTVKYALSAGKKIIEL